MRSAMPPKIRPRGKAAAQAAAAALAAPLNLTIQLQGGEQDLQNVAYITTLTEAWALVSNHPNFNNVQQAIPLSLAEGGAQVPHKLPVSQTICLRSAWAATGGSLHWNSHPMQGLLAQLTLLGWTSSGQPLRVSQCAWLLRDTAFKSPSQA